MKDHPCCPLCHTALNNIDIDNLKSELSDHIESLPQNLADAEQKLKEQNEKLEKLLGLQPSVARLENLRSEQLPKIRNELTNTEALLHTAHEKQKTAEKAMEEPKQKQNIITMMIGDISVLDEAVKDVDRSKKQLVELKSSLGDSSSIVNIEDLRKQRKELLENIRRLESETEKKQKKVDEHSNNIRKFDEVEKKTRDKEYILRGEIQNYTTLKNQKQELIKQSDEIESKKKSSETALEPVKRKVRHAVLQRQQTKDANAQALRTAKQRFDNIKRTYDSMDRLSNELKKIAAQNLENAIERSEAKLGEIRTEKTNQVKELN